MVTRARNMAFAGGAAVFPGGRIDDADHELAAQLGGSLGMDETAARIGGIRETLEETGLAIGLTHKVATHDVTEARKMLIEGQELAPVLDRFGWQLDLEALVPFARWRPNFKHKRIFDARFYLTNLGTGAVDIAVDETENTRLFWISAREALAKADRGEIEVIFPTRRNLERIAQFDSFAAAENHARSVPIRTITPWIETMDGHEVLRFGDDHGYPVTYERLTTAVRG